MITEAKSEQFLSNSMSELDSIDQFPNAIDHEPDSCSKKCFSNEGDNASLENMTFSIDITNPKNCKSKLLRKIDEFKMNNPHIIYEELKNNDHMAQNHGINQILNTTYASIKNFCINKQSLHVIMKKEEKKHSILMKKLENTMNSSLKAAISSALHSNFLFHSLAEIQKNVLLDNFSCFSVETANTILQEGEITEYIYFIEKGSVAKLIKGKVLSQICKNNIIGSEMILSINQMTCSYIALESCILWGIRCRVLAKIMLAMNEEKYSENRKFLEPLPFFSSLSERQKDELSYNMNDVEYVKWKTIISEQDDVQNFFIIKEGCVLVTQKNNFLYYLNKGDSFGDNFFMKSKRNFTVKVESNCVNCLCINKKKFRKILGKDSNNLIINSNIRMMLKKSFFFSKLFPLILEKIFKEISVLCYASNTNVQMQNDQKEIQLCFIIDGALICFDDKNVFNPGLIIGEELFLDESYQMPLELKTTQDSVLGFITKSQIEKITGMSGINSFKKHLERKNRVNSTVIEPKKKLEIDSAKVFIIKEIGEGVSGLVFLVSYELKYYALKIISKGWIIENKLENYIRNEKKIHEKITFPLVTSLVTTWKDDISVYFLMEYIQGKELFEIYHDKGVLEVSEIIYLAASLILTLEYLHMKGIIHRDLKPENIIIDENGCIKVCDLGFGKILISNSERSYTIVGTHNYMSPEMIMGKGYSFLVDYWSLGVLLYEAFYARLPFADGFEDPYLICEEIIKKKVVFPKEIRNKNTKNLIQQLLSKSPEIRLGQGGVDGLKALRMFESVNWEGVLDNTMESPFKMFMNFTAKNFKNTEKSISLAEVMENQDVKGLKEMTMKLNMESDFPDWDTIF